MIATRYFVHTRQHILRRPARPYAVDLVEHRAGELFDPRRVGVEADRDLVTLPRHARDG